MRLWSGEGGLMTDEQVLAYVAHFGGLSAALEHGDIKLVAGAGSQKHEGGRGDSPRTKRNLKLADYLSEND